MIRNSKLSKHFIALDGSPKEAEFSSYRETTAVGYPVLQHAVIRESMAWLYKYSASAEFGDYPLGKPNWYANVNGYETLPETECCWENYMHTIDIQFLISGSERIRWASVDLLGPPQRYLKQKDRQEFDHLTGLSSLITLRAGSFAMFMPGEAHCPKISLGESNVLRKAVVKIPAILLGE